MGLRNLSYKDESCARVRGFVLSAMIYRDRTFHWREGRVKQLRLRLVLTGPPRRVAPVATVAAWCFADGVMLGFGLMPVRASAWADQAHSFDY